MPEQKVIGKAYYFSGEEGCDYCQANAGFHINEIPEAPHPYCQCTIEEYDILEEEHEDYAEGLEPEAFNDTMEEELESYLLGIDENGRYSTEDIESPLNEEEDITEEDLNDIISSMLRGDDSSSDPSSDVNPSAPPEDSQTVDLVAHFEEGNRNAGGFMRMSNCQKTVVGNIRLSFSDRYISQGTQVSRNVSPYSTIVPSIMQQNIRHNLPPIFMKNWTPPAVQNTRAVVTIPAFKKAIWEKEVTRTEIDIVADKICIGPGGERTKVGEITGKYTYNTSIRIVNLRFTN